MRWRLASALIAALALGASLYSADHESLPAKPSEPVLRIVLFDEAREIVLGVENPSFPVVDWQHDFQVSLSLENNGTKNLKIRTLKRGGETFWFQQPFEFKLIDPSGKEAESGYYASINYAGTDTKYEDVVLGPGKTLSLPPVHAPGFLIRKSGKYLLTATAGIPDEQGTIHEYHTEPIEFTDKAAGTVQKR